MKVKKHVGTVLWFKTPLRFDCRLWCICSVVFQSSWQSLGVMLRALVNRGSGFLCLSGAGSWLKLPSCVLQLQLPMFLQSPSSNQDFLRSKICRSQTRHRLISISRTRTDCGPSIWPFGRIECLPRDSFHASGETRWSWDDGMWRGRRFPECACSRGSTAKQGAWLEGTSDQPGGCAA